MVPRRSERLHRTLLLAVAVLAALRPGTLRAVEEPQGIPLVVSSGLDHAGDLVALQRPVTIDGILSGDLVAVGCDVHVSGRISGKLILLGGSASLTRNAMVGGDFLAVGSRVDFVGTSAATAVKGRTLTLDALETAFVSELQTSPLTRAAVSPLLLSFRILILTCWFCVGLALLAVVPRSMMGAASAASGYEDGVLVFSPPQRLGVMALAGAAAVLTAFLATTLLLMSVSPGVTIGVMAVLLFLLLSAKVFGLSVLLLVLGRWLARRSRRGDLFFGDPAALSLGLLALGCVSLIPVFGPIAWSAASLAGIGLSLSSSLGFRRRERLAAGRLTASRTAA